MTGFNGTPQPVNFYNAVETHGFYGKPLSNSHLDLIAKSIEDARAVQQKVQNSSEYKSTMAELLQHQNGSHGI